MSATESAPGVLPNSGDIVAGKYCIGQVLGVGGMGAVMAATHVHLGEQVAIKFMTGAGASDQERVARFRREAWAAAKIKSEHVGRVHDVGTLPNGTHYLVMEFLDGQDLEQLDAEQPLPMTTAIDYVLQAAEALAEAHVLGIVHRDLKPANLFLTRRADGSHCIKLLDFGVSKITTADGITKTSALMGSPLYMSPEQLASSKHVDARADIWSLGVILFALVSNGMPFTGDTMPQVIASVMQKQPIPLRTFRPDISPALEAAIMRCMARDIDQRYPDLAHFATALAPFGSPAAQRSASTIHNVISAATGETIAAHPAAHPAADLRTATDAGSTVAIGGVTAVGVATETRTPERSGLVWGVIAGGITLMVVAAAAGVWWAATGGGAPASATAPATTTADAAVAAKTPAPLTSNPMGTPSASSSASSALPSLAAPSATPAFPTTTVPAFPARPYPGGTKKWDPYRDR